MQGTMPGAHRRGRPGTAWMDNIKMWTGLPVEESIRMTEINGESTSVVWPTVRSRTAKNKTEQVRKKIKRVCVCVCATKQYGYSSFAATGKIFSPNGS